MPLASLATCQVLAWLLLAATIFQSEGAQAVRLPLEARFADDVKALQVRALGAERILTPAGRSWDGFFLSEPAADEDFMADRVKQEARA